MCEECDGTECENHECQPQTDRSNLLLFTLPDFTYLPSMELRTREIMESYTRLKPCIVEGGDEAHNAFLVVGHQSFCITAIPGTVEESSWMCWQLAKALQTLLKQECHAEIYK